ncbi:MAG: hypothetical protein HQ402_03855 [Parcubacteria group bacterium]|nr:hypothetical protein [Parcubacteria group bacterium]
MPHISKNKLDDKTFTQIHDKLIKTISGLRNRNTCKDFMGELLTRTEKIMLAKRLAIIFMVNENISIYEISNILQVSPSTVARISNGTENNSYNHILKIINKKQYGDLSTTIEKFILMGMPPRTSKNRWKFLNRLH